VQEPEPEPPNPLAGYRVLEITLREDSPASGQALGAVPWPDGYVPVSVLRGQDLQEPDPALTLTAGDRVCLLAPAAGHDNPSAAVGGS
jgi:Trk K+ transport system NAD-binding subunit